MAEPALDTQDFPPLPGAVPLKAFLDGLDKSLPDWCEEKDLDRFSIQKLLNGKLQRVSVELAFDLEEATGGVIPATLWIPTEEIRDMQREKRAATARARARAARTSEGADGSR